MATKILSPSEFRALIEAGAIFSPPKSFNSYEQSAQNVPLFATDIEGKWNDIPTPVPRTYTEWHETCLALTQQYCPKATLITDTAKDKHIMWLSYKGHRLELALSAGAHDAKAPIIDTCVRLREMVAGEELT